MNIIGSSPFYAVLCFMPGMFVFMLESNVLCPGIEIYARNLAIYDQNGVKNVTSY